jgi:hypothetical protein
MENRLLSPKQLIPALGGGLTLPHLRKLLLHRKTNGLEASGAIITLGRRKILIDVFCFLTFLRSFPTTGRIENE